MKVLSQEHSVKGIRPSYPKKKPRSTQHTTKERLTFHPGSGQLLNLLEKTKEKQTTKESMV